MSKTETTNVKRIFAAGDTKKLPLFCNAVENAIARKSAEDRPHKMRHKHRLDRRAVAASHFYLPVPEARVKTQAGYQRLINFQPEDFLHDTKNHQDFFGYSPADVGKETEDAGPHDHEQVPATMVTANRDLQGMCIINKDPAVSKDREFIDAMIQNQPQSDESVPIKEAACG